jgi:hypothetical protein
MKTHSYSHSQTRLSIALLFAGASLLHAQTRTDSVPRLSVGALLNLDAGGVPPGDLSVDRVPLELTDAELGIGLHLRPDLDFRTVMVDEDGIATVDKAFATWKSPLADLEFGQAVLPLGLYPGRLIHDPALQQDVETVVPALVATREMGPFALHVSGAQLAYQTDSVETEFPALVAAADFKWGGEGIARLSGKLAHHVRTVDAAAQVPLGPLALDLEGVATDGAFAGCDLAGLLGLSWRLHEALSLAARLDARQEHGSDEWNTWAVAGATAHVAEFAYVGAEWLQDLDGDGELTLRLGLEGGFSLP